MVDSRFFQNHGPFRLQQLAEVTGAELAPGGNPELVLNDVAPLDRATKQDISFLDNNKYVDSFSQSQAGACFIRKKHMEFAPKGMALLVSDEPYTSYALAAQRFYPMEKPAAAVAKIAQIDPTAIIGKNVAIGHGAVIGPHAEIGDHCIIGPNAVIGHGVTIGEHSTIGPTSTVSYALIGKRVYLHPGVHIGQDGFGFAMSSHGHVKVPQLGRVVIEDDVEIGAGTCIDRGTGPDTTIGAGTKIDNLVQIGHNVHIGRLCVIVAQVGISGSTRIGDGTVLAGQAGLAGHLKIGSGVKIAAQSGVMNDIPSGASWGGYPAVPIKDWHRQTVAINRLIRKKGENEA